MSKEGWGRVSWSFVFLRTPLYAFEASSGLDGRRGLPGPFLGHRCILTLSLGFSPRWGHQNPVLVSTVKVVGVGAAGTDHANIVWFPTPAYSLALSDFTSGAQMQR